MIICTRKYSENSLLATKEINGVACCTNCEKPVEAHNQMIERRYLIWSLAGDTGISSETLAAHMLGVKKGGHFGMQPPSDSADRGRCIRLLELIPEWLPRLKEMVQYDNGKPSGITISSSGINTDTNTWSKQIPLILMEGKFL